MFTATVTIFHYEEIPKREQNSKVKFVRNFVLCPNSRFRHCLGNYRRRTKYRYHEEIYYGRTVKGL